MAGEDRKINVGLSFTADTSKARQELDKLKNDLNKITTQGFSGEKITTPLQQSVEYAGELKAMLDAATDTSGKLNLSKFSNELTKSGKTLADFNNVITTGGKEGVAVMNSLAQQIRSADANATILSGTLKKFFDGLKNTAMWTIQSNAIHAVESALSGAYSYAQKLNKGLTDIAIVSDLNTKQLAEFARTANQMAKELSASTSEYVSGALIYYQAGLSDEEVIERTNTTIKLAETSGESAEAISSYMTAIWNNFYDGSKSVEYYADAISYLGAVTAASNADIAEGMQAFSAVADTVGLSFEYGASALTLLRDITQQSASTIGNSLKTIFARLSSVTQGDTLEDGVDLTKYSKALAQVGVNVLDANQNLRDMDDILDDLGARWNSLNEAQKVALAQTVGGVRQYNNLISLMDNYEQFQELVGEASGSEGYLNHQAEIYAESWEAAANRVEAAWQGLYQQLIDDKFFIALTSGLAGIVNGITKIVDGLGGIWGLLPAIASLYFTIGKDSSINGLLKIRNTTQEIIYNLREAKKENQNNQIDAAGILLQNTTSAATTNTTLQYYDRLREKLDFLRDHQNSMTKAQISMFEQDIERIKQVINYLGELDEKIVANELSFMELENRYGVDSGTTDKAKTYSRYAKAFQDIGDVRSDFDLAKEMANEYLTKDNLISSVSNKYTGGKELLQKIANASVHEIDDLLKQFETYLKQGFQDIQDTVKLDALETRLTEIEQGNTSEDDVNRIAALNAIKQEILAEDQAIVIQEQKMGDLTEEQKQDLEQQKQELDAIAKRYEELAKNDTNFSQQRESARATARGLLGDKSKEAEILDQEKWAQSIQSVLRFSTSITTLGTSFNRLWDSIASGKADLGTITGALMGLGSSIVSLLNMTKTLSGMGGILGWLGTGPHMAIIISAVLALVAGFKWLKKAQEDAYAQSIAGKIEANNKALEKQKEIVNNLANEYNNLTSEVENLQSAYEELNNMEPGTAKYLIKLQEYEDKLDEIEQKYGDVFNYDENGNRTTVNEDKIDAAILRQMYAAQSEQIRLENRSQQLNTQQVWEDTWKDRNKGISSQTFYNQNEARAENGYRGTEYTAYHFKGDESTIFDDIYLKEDEYNQIWDNLQNLIKSGELNSENFEEKFKTAVNGHVDDAVYDFFFNKIETYTQALEDEQSNTQNFSDLAHNVLSGKGLLGFGEKDVDIDSAVNDIYQNYIDSFKETKEDGSQEFTEAIQNEALEQYARIHDAILENGVLYSKNENGEKGAALEDVDLEGIIGDYLAGELNAELANLNQFELAQRLNETAEANGGTAIFNEDQMREFYQNAQEDWRKTSFMQEADARGLDKDELQDYAGYLASISEESDNLADSLKEDSDAAILVARSVMSMNKGIETLSDNWDEWGDVLDKSSKESKEYYEALQGTRGALSDLFEVQGDFISDDFIAEHLDEIKEAATGDEEAIEKLRAQLSNQIVADILVNNGIEGEDRDKILASVEALQKDLGKIEVGAQLNLDDFNNDEDAFLERCNEIISSAGMTAEQANAFFDSMGFETTFATEEVPVLKNGHGTRTVTKPVGELTVKMPDGSTHTIPGGYETYTYAGEPYQYVDYVETIAMESNSSSGGKKVPKITSITKKANASMNNRSSTNKGGGGGSKGSGGSSSKQKTKEPERYHEINAKIQQNQAEITKLTALENRLYGQEKLDAMEREAELLEEQAKLYEQKYQEALRYYEMDKKNLQNNYGATFNPDGTIANYDEWYGKYLAQYNSGKMDDDAWSKFEDAIKKYEESLNLLDETEKAKLDATNKAFDKGLENIEYRLKTINELIDKDIDYLDYMIKQLDKSMYDTADVIALIGKKTEDVYQKTLNEQKAIEDILKHHGGLSDEDIAKFMSGQEDISDIIAKVKDLTETEVKNLMEHQSALIKYNETLIELREEAYEKLGESIDEFNDKIERQKDIISDLDGVMNHYRNIIDIVGKDTLGISDEMLRQMSELSVTAAKGALEISRDELTKNQAMLEGLYKRREELLAAGREADARLLDKEIEAQEDRVRQLSEAWASAWEDALKAAEEAFKNSIRLATDAFSQAMAGTIGSLDDLQEAMDMQNTLNERYLPTYQKIYELNKLTRDVNNAIDNTNNIAGKERLLKLQQDIVKKQEDGAELTEYELGMFQRRLELEQARIAMEEAQNAKNMVRMTRDSEGNWSYTYTADSEAAAQAEQNYEDKLYDLKKYNQDSMKEFEDAMWQAVNEYKNSIADLDLTDEERAQRIHDFQQQWVEHNKDMFQMTLDDAQWILDTYGGVDDLINTFMETISGKTTQYSDLTDFFSQFNESSQQMMDEVGTSYRTWDEQYKDIFEKAGTSADDFKDKVTEDMKAIEESIVGEDGEGGAVGAAKELGDQMTEQFDGIMENLRKWFEGEDGGYSKMIDSIVSQNEKLYGSIQALLSAYAKLGQVSNFAGDNKDIKVGEVDTGTGQGEIPTGLASGGYTGSWGNTGKLAVLHEKELVLNQADTENLLTTVNFVRDLTRMISLNAADASAGLGNLFMGGVGQGGGYLDQTVTIHAEFPNATNHSEIEEAFSNLIGLASQYAGRKK